MSKAEIFLISKSSSLQNIFNDMVERNCLLESVALIENEDYLLKNIFNSDITRGVYVYDSDFSPRMSSTWFVQVFNKLSPETKIIILGNDVTEARKLINEQACPFGYINKKEKSTLIVEHLLALI
ncbi:MULTISPECIES: hypothetical protein [unclassified Enterococcus]|uniref:hypothetical protein n=1 Tax=unclassified Enterococcus TaxID=2608891 RepID=UPI0028FD7BDF|nr:MULTISPECIES: hypothetical protein [unclassified Enterococcus]MDU0320669.1 hypothetical protein [Enterococcus sp. 2STP]MDU0334862.1 hypothetical protein [Enterococcus sp. 2CBP]MDU0350395.1 hypothetical protein [Enterococcus sp. 3MOLP]